MSWHAYDQKKPKKQICIRLEESVLKRIDAWCERQPKKAWQRKTTRTHFIADGIERRLKATEPKKAGN